MPRLISIILGGGGIFEGLGQNQEDIKTKIARMPVLLIKNWPWKAILPFSGENRIYINRQDKQDYCRMEQDYIL